MAITAKALDFVQQKGKERGLWGDSSKWLGIWVLVTGVRWLSRTFSRDPIVVRETLEPGQQLIITHFEKPSKRSR